jgi:Flp pilus assembly protein TadG
VLATILRRFGFAHRNQRGQVMIVAVFLIAAICGAAALAVDVGNYLSHRRSLQNSADAIALAASLDLPDSSDTQDAAEEWAVNNGIDPDDVTVTITQQSLPDTPNPIVEVEIEEDHSFSFARVVGIEEQSITVSATAIKTSPGGGNGLMPWSVLEEVKDDADPGDVLVLKYDSNNVTNGNFGALRLDGNGANVYRTTIEFGSENTFCAVTALDCTDPSVVQTQPGNMTGPTRTATDYRINNTSSSCDTWDEVVIENADGTHGLTPACNPFTAGGDPNSLRVIVIPVIDSLCNGACNVTITEFALFFLEGYGAGGCTGNDCEIKGRFIYSNTNYGAIVGTYDADTTVHFVRLIS